MAALSKLQNLNLCVLLLLVAAAVASCGGRTPQAAMLSDASGDDRTIPPSKDDASGQGDSGSSSSSGSSTGGQSSGGNAGGATSSGIASSSGSSSGLAGSSSSGASSSSGIGSSASSSGVGGDAGFPTPFSPLTPGMGPGANCPPTCDPGTLCVDDTVQKVCAKACSTNLDCPGSDCCTLLSDGSKACVATLWSGPMPGQLCLCTYGSHCPDGALSCAPAVDNLGNPTGPEVCHQ
jgi:hypothetical protein